MKQVKFIKTEGYPKLKDEWLREHEHDVNVKILEMTCNNKSIEILSIQTILNDTTVVISQITYDIPSEAINVNYNYSSSDR